MKKLLIFLMILTLICVAVSCGDDQTPAETTAESTKGMRPMPPETMTTTLPSTVVTTAPTQNGTQSTTQAPNASEVPSVTEAPDTTKAPDTAKKPVITTRDPGEGWGDLIPIR